jgi:glycosyltransferase involved in cell wall biosynthesis
MLVTALIPCLNEEFTIEKIVNELLSLNLPIDVLVIDNNSTDKTAETALLAGARVVKESIPGKGAAVRRGFLNLHPKATHVFMVDGDSTYSLSQIESAIKLINLQSYDMIIGRRLSTTSIAEKSSSFPKFHSIGNYFLSLVFKLLFRSKISDTLSGWRLMTRPFVDSFPSVSRGFQIESELNTHAHALDIAVREIDVDYFPRPEGSFSKLNTFKDGTKILRRNLQLFKSHKPLISFIVLAFPWFGISSFLTVRVLEGWLKFQEIRLPSILLLITSFLVFLNLWTTGIVLERITLQKNSSLRFEYKHSSDRLNSVR